jgi:hypothetical protein
MALHRDIHWIGRQWAVTGLGMQLIDQKLKGFFDIEVWRLWEEELIETTRAKEWLNVADFDRGLEVARNRFPAGGVTQTPPAETVAPASPIASSIAAVAPQAMPIAPAALQPMPAIATPEPAVARPVPPEFNMLFSGNAKFVRPWRVRMKK